MGRSKLLSSISFKMEKGKATCLLGESENGKTTLTEISQKNYQPESSNILINENLDLKIFL